MKKIHSFFKLYNYSIKDVKGRWGRVEGRGDQVKRIHNRRIRTSSLCCEGFLFLPCNN
jgi:hypothetical protein